MVAKAAAPPAMQAMPGKRVTQEMQGTQAMQEHGRAKARTVDWCQFQLVHWTQLLSCRTLISRS
jgi:hypothetical protein